MKGFLILVICITIVVLRDGHNRGDVTRHELECERWYRASHVVSPECDPARIEPARIASADMNGFAFVVGLIGLGIWFSISPLFRDSRK